LLLDEIGQFGKASGIDMSSRAIEYCKERGLNDVSVGDATVLQYPDASFDAIIILDVIEHIEDDAAACRELARVLKPGGIVIIMVPAFMFLWGVTDVLSHHYRRYTKREIVARVKGANLSIARATYFNTFLFPLIALVRVTVRLLKIPVTSESEMGGSLGNAILYAIFRLESLALKYMNFPFGVSVLLVAIKK
jgi:SAM-dependent methyltransferase